MNIMAELYFELIFLFTKLQMHQQDDVKKDNIFGGI